MTTEARLRIHGLEDEDQWVMESSIACAYTGDYIEYTDGVIVLFMMQPFVKDGQLLLYDIRTGDGDDYYYEPTFFHTKSWSELDENFFKIIEQNPRPRVDVDGAVLTCKYCHSGILEGETVCVPTFGELQRSERNPDGGTASDHFENLDQKPLVICIACMMDFNTEVHEAWPDGVCHDEECKQGTYARCWRSGCPGNCPLKATEE